MSALYYEKIIKRENGTQYQLCVNAYFLNKMEYKINAYFRLKNKRKWTPILRDIADFQYRSLNLQQRSEYDAKNLLRFFSKEELYNVKLELWESIKPNIE